MKKLFLLLSLVFSSTAWAQLHVDLGSGITHVDSPYPGTGASVGCFVDAGYRLTLSEKLVLDPILQLSWQGEKEYGTLYVKMPVILSYRLGRVELGAGPYVAYGLWDKKNEERYYYERPPHPWSRSAFGYFRRFDLGLSARTTFHFQSLYCGIEGYYGLLDVADKDWWEQFSARNMGISLLIGHLF